MGYSEELDECGKIIEELKEEMENYSKEKNDINAKIPKLSAKIETCRKAAERISNIKEEYQSLPTNYREAIEDAKTYYDTDSEEMFAEIQGMELTYNQMENIVKQLEELKGKILGSKQVYQTKLNSFTERVRNLESAISRCAQNINYYQRKLNE